MQAASPDHPQLGLLFALEGLPDDEMAGAMKVVADELEAARDWSVSRPAFVDEFDEDSMTQPGDEPIRTVGVLVHVYSGMPHGEHRLPVDVDRAQYQDVAYLVGRMAKLSQTLGQEIVVEYAGEAIGWIEGGIPDRGLTEGFLEEWSKSLAVREAR